MNQQALDEAANSRTNVIGLRQKPIRLLRGFHSTIDAITGEKFVEAMRGAATGVNIVTTDGSAGRWGLTLSAFSSVSAEPPMVLVCINRRSPVCAAVLENGHFCVNVLAATQQDMANRFAGFPTDGEPYHFDAASWQQAASGAPLLSGCTATFDCKVTSAVDAGTHTIFIGLVHNVEGNNAAPLLYTNRTYRRACCDA